MILITWNELPVYGAKILRACIDSIEEDVYVLTTNSNSVTNEVVELLNNRLIVIDGSESINLTSYGLPVPRIYFQAGIRYIKPFVQIGKIVKSNGGKVILLSDNSYKGTLRQLFGKLLMRFYYLRKFDAVWVPGFSGEKLMQYFGFESKQIFRNLYAVDSIQFNNTSFKNKNFTYVGRFVYEKGFIDLLCSYKRYINQGGKWGLTLMGSGPLEEFAKSFVGVKIIPHATPSNVANLLSTSRVFVLPSYSDHWPLVIAEAAASGCGMIISDRVGNSIEFALGTTSVIVDAGSIEQLVEAMFKFENLSDFDFKMISKRSRKLSLDYTIDNSVSSFINIIQHTDSHKVNSK